MKAARVMEPPGLPSDKNGAPDDAAFFKAASGVAEGNEPFCEITKGTLGVGPAFLDWYTQVLVAHGEAILDEAISALQEAGCAQVDPTKLAFSVKVSGIHWHTMHASRAAEACAGYNCSSSPKADAYKEIASMLQRATRKAKRPVMFNFTCLEMNNWSGCDKKTNSAPEDLIAQVRQACVHHNVPLCGENALEFDPATSSWAFEQMK